MSDETPKSDKPAETLSNMVNVPADAIAQLFKSLGLAVEKIAERGPINASEQSTTRPSTQDDGNDEPDERDTRADEHEQRDTPERKPNKRHWFLG